MSFPFSINSAEDWLNVVPKYLLTLEDSHLLYNKGFHQYIGSNLEIYFLKASDKFFSVINSILTSGTEYGKYIVLEALLHAKSIWRYLCQEYNLQPILLELALSPDKIYTKSAVQLSSYLEELTTQLKEEESFEESENDLEVLSESVLGSVLDDEVAEMPKKEIIPHEEALKSEEELKPEAEPIPPPPPSAGLATKAGAPPAPTPAREPEPILAPTPAAPPPTVAAPDKMMREEATKKRAKAKKEKPETFPLEEFVEPEKDNLHTHVHYYSRMNPRKTYPFTVSISRVAKALKADKIHFLSGETEKETRGEFEIPDDLTKQLIAEPLIPGCLIQPTFQYFSPQPKYLPKELTFFVTPLIETGFRSTALQGSLFIKNDFGIILLKLDLPDLAITTHRVSQVLATIGTIGGGAMPALDFMFGGNIQGAVVNQLRSYLPTLADQIDMRMVLTGTQITIFLGALGLGLLWWWKKSRAKLAPKYDMVLQLPQ
ncbi:MAG: hypothetical protein ACFFAU_08670 [Candidatus Hodarchaeota archaeon]